MTCGESVAPITVRKWIGDVSAERVGQLWRAEDHEALLRTMRRIPRPRGRGPIEARRAKKPTTPAIKFRDRAVAAPLKHWIKHHTPYRHVNSATARSRPH